jgi:hypothetical protein
MPRGTAKEVHEGCKRAHRKMYDLARAERKEQQNNTKPLHTQKVR